MKISTLQLGVVITNCYILADEESGLCAVIDPADKAERIIEEMEKMNVTPAMILLTHGHFDHVGGVAGLLRKYPDLPVYLHEGDLGQHRYQGMGLKYDPRGNHRAYGEGDELTLGSLTIHVYSTPGHSEGSVCLQVNDVLFCGDTLFAASCGRTDLPGGDYDTIMASLRRIAGLEGNLRCLPGHMSATWLDREREYNSFMRMALKGV
ncbi:MAG: MBL fold metallo-hydrolase [Oscillospiraceae bacterium]|nr:MBL fold metallo-hydrolase [Oscillospiraceae bacterium]